MDGGIVVDLENNSIKTVGYGVCRVFVSMSGVQKRLNLLSETLYLLATTPLPLPVRLAHREGFLISGAPKIQQSVQRGGLKNASPN